MITYDARSREGFSVKERRSCSSQEVKGLVVQAQLRATFYPKFENEKSDQEVNLSFLLPDVLWWFV